MCIPKMQVFKDLLTLSCVPASSPEPWPARALFALAALVGFTFIRPIVDEQS
jgi:MYXO-CTERM domain-containing protein